MKLHELHSQSAAQRTMQETEPADDDTTSLISDEDFWEAIELLEECVVEMERAQTEYTSDSRNDMVKQVADVKEFINMFVVGVGE